MIKVVNPLVQVLGLGGIFIVVDKAAALGPNAFEESPQAPNESDLKALGAQAFLSRVA